jgi:hypothetical protein
VLKIGMGGSTKEGSEKKKKNLRITFFLHFYLSLLNEKQVGLFF